MVASTPGDGGSGVLHGEQRVVLPILLRLAAFLDESGRGGGPTPSPIQGDHRPNEIRLADVGPRLSALNGRRVRDTTRVARPLPLVSGDERSTSGGELHFFPGHHQLPTLQRGAGYYVAGMRGEDFDGGKMGCVLGLEIPAPSNARGS